MSARTTSVRRRHGQRDEGSALILVLVMMVICSLIVIPLMNYAISVGRANTVLSNKTRRIEAVKAGLRMALADPDATYATCGQAGPTVARSLPSITVNDIGVSTRCYYVDSQSALLDDQLRYGLAVTQVGETIPAALKGNRWTGNTTEGAWVPVAKRQSETDTIWLPELPMHATTIRSSAGFEMPVPPATPENPAPKPCRVYFPGTYRDPITLDSSVFFTSGVYYFENTVSVVPGADVVVGDGPNFGCTFDQEAAFTAIDGPSTHNITGMGAVWVFGGKGRLSVNNTPASGPEKPISLKFNRRYVLSADGAEALPSDVSIISVNGEIDASNNVVPLVEPGVISVPLKLDAAEANQIASYKPSLLTPKPKVPDAVGLDDTPDPTASARNGAIVVSWTAPFDGGSKITGYTVTASSGATVAGTCSTTGATTCAITGLTNGTQVSVSVVATNAKGPSIASAPITVTPTAASTGVGVPTWPTSNTPTVTAYKSAARVTWVAPNLGTGNLPIKSYTVTAYSTPTATPAGTCTVDATTGVTPEVRTCIVDFTAPYNLLGYTFSVVANNAFGPSAATNASLPVLVDPINPLLPARPADPTPAAYPKFRPTPIVEFDLARASTVTVEIPGYVSIPQGRIRVSNPNGHSITVVGGILAAQFDVTDKRGVDASGNEVAASIDFGFVETIVQRKFKIVSTTTSGGPATSRAIVQINQTGNYAVNQWEVV